MGLRMFFKPKHKGGLLQAVAEFVFANSPDAYFVLDNQTIVACNRAMETLMGLPREQLIGLTPDRLSPERQPDGRLSAEKVVDNITNALAKGFTRFEWLHQRLDGTKLPVEVTMLPGNVLGRDLFICFWHDLRDVMQLREAEQAAQARAAETARVTGEAVNRLGEALARVAGGDLTIRLDQDFPSVHAKVRSDFNGAIDRLQRALGVIVLKTKGIGVTARNITKAADKLAERSGQQTGTLQEAVSALTGITDTVRKTAEGAKDAREAAEAAKADAQNSGAVVHETVAAMGGIEQSARQIGNITGVIDEIAFQTNLLALNAGVEAARAGDAGRGFAVVATEVRALAQRSADAAKEIKTLISTSGQQVDKGVKLVGETGKALERIVAQVVQLNGLVTDIAASAQAQAAGLNDVNKAVRQMDQATHQNAAMMTDSTNASHSLAADAEELASLVGQFEIGRAPGDASPARQAPAQRPAASPPRPAPPPSRKPLPDSLIPRPDPVNRVVAVSRKDVPRSPPPKAEEEWDEF